MSDKSINATAIIQARLSSTRFPGKVLRDIAGKPLIWHILHRLKKSKHIQTIVIATSDQPSDDSLVDYCRAQDISFVRGPLDNVLERFRLAQEAFPSDYIVRITGDSPLVDPWVLDYGLEKLAEIDADIITGDRHDYLHEGFDIMKTSFLQRLLTEKHDDPAAREHVSGYITLHPNYGNVALMTLPESHILAGARISVDTPEDKAFIEALYAESKAQVGDLSIEEAVQILKEKPELLTLNNFVRQKRADETTLNILMVPEIRDGMGLGHEMRLKALANHLKTHHSLGICFAVPQGKIEQYQQQGFSTKAIQNPNHKGPELKKLLSNEAFQGVILDIRDETSLSDLKAIKSTCPKIPIVIIDDGTERKLAADMAFYPLVANLNTKGMTEHVFQGLDYALVPPLPKLSANMPTHFKPLITMGGSDPHNLSPMLATLCEQLEIPFDLIIGPNFKDKNKLVDQIQSYSMLGSAHQNVSNISTLAGDYSALICGYGITAYEALMLGRPPLIICHNEEDLENATLFETLGLGLLLGSFQTLTNNSLKDTLLTLKAIPSKLLDLKKVSEGYSVGDNVARIADKIIGLLKK